MIKETEKIEDMISIVANIVQIIGTLLNVFLAKNEVLAIIFILCIICFFRKRHKLKKELNDIQEKLAEKDESFDALKKELAEKDKRLNALEERMKACKDAFKEQKYTLAGHYLVYKDEYDEFRTDLWLLECNLDVEILEWDEQSQKGNLQFKWRLEIENRSSELVKTAHFIYSGDKGKEKNVDIDIWVKMGDLKSPVKRTTKNIDVPGDDCFIMINLGSGISYKQRATITISYVFTKYEVIKNFDRIWIVPDALGFSGMDSFRIRFYRNEAKNYQKATLETYSLKGKYDRKEESECPFDEIEDKKWGFEAKCEEKSKFHDLGYMLVLKKE